MEYDADCAAFRYLASNFVLLQIAVDTALIRVWLICVFFQLNFAEIFDYYWGIYENSSSAIHCGLENGHI
jgi:hypothetical protein